jgi:hypothetical protein
MILTLLVMTSPDLTAMLSVSTHPKKPTRPKINEGEMKINMPTLQQNQKSCISTLKAHTLQHICFCPTHPSPPTTLTDNYQFERPIKSKSIHIFETLN